MDMRLTFDEDAANYDQWRPRYCDKLFEDVIRYSEIDSEKNAVEIGCGTGQATEPFLKTGCSVIAVELGKQLASFTKNKFAKYSNFQVENVAFEVFQHRNDSIDLVYSATAFHWIPEEIGYKKVFDMLKKGGTIALFWNKPRRPDDLLNQKIDSIYTNYEAEGKFSSSVSANVIKGSKSAADDILKYGFIELMRPVYKQTRKFTAENYISLLNTYSDHRAMKPLDQYDLYNDITLAINSFGGSIEIYDSIELYLAKKP
jgi:SAM-dependent methyltransferase